MPKSAHTEYYSYPPNSGAVAAANPANALVSVIIPIYNAEPFLDQALNSVRNQTYEHLEIICLNDGSTDNSLEIMRKHEEEDPRIAVIDKQNQGYGATCNRGIDESHGEWIAILEPDDWIEPGMYADMISFASSFAEKIDIIKTPYWRIVQPDTPHQRKLNCSYKRRVQIEKQPFVITDAIHLLHHHPSIWSALYRKSFLVEHGIRFKPIPGAGWADNPFLVETLCQARNIAYLDKAYYCYREETKEKSSAFHRKNPMVPFDRWNEMLDIIERLGITDKDILCAHYSRGFVYMGGVLEEHSLEEPMIREQLERMFGRMDPDLVFEFPELSPGFRRLFADIRGLPTPKSHHALYALNLAEQGIYNLKNTGVENTLEAVTNYLTQYRRRTGGK